MKKVTFAFLVGLCLATGGIFIADAKASPSEFSPSKISDSQLQDPFFHLDPNGDLCEQLERYLAILKPWKDRFDRLKATMEQLQEQIWDVEGEWEQSSGDARKQLQQQLRDLRAQLKAVQDIYADLYFQSPVPPDRIDQAWDALTNLQAQYC
ncbi:MAG: hypothetical protein KDD70_12330 [Bdellovibrionales bacterium]|nr:hypothetical protein [Bdellovibrionales bacterium]